jgi:hypothetical protein
VTTASDALAFPLCADPAHEERVRAVLDASVRFLTERLPRRDLVALALTGSFARGEGSVLPVNGHLRVLGDMEFFAVVAEGADSRGLGPRLAALGRQATASLGRGDVVVDLEFGALSTEYLRRRAQPSIFLYDLATHGKVLWGDRDALAQMRPFGACHIPPEDAVYLLFNRTIEQLDAYERIGELEGEALLEVAYQRLKLLLDLAGSALAFRGAHVASYRDRPAAFARLRAETPALGELLPPGFEDDLARAALAKIAPRPDGLDLPPLEAPPAAQRAWLRRQIEAGVPALGAFLRWELEERLGRRADLSDLLARWLEQPSLGRRVWDWAKVALHPLPPPLPLGLLRCARLFLRSTPRALLYAAGARAYLNLAGSGAGSPAITALLPVRRRWLPRDARAERRAVAALWRWCVRNN